MYAFTSTRLEFSKRGLRQQLNTVDYNSHSNRVVEQNQGQVNNLA